MSFIPPLIAELTGSVTNWAASLDEAVDSLDEFVSAVDERLTSLNGSFDSLNASIDHIDESFDAMSEQVTASVDTAATATDRAMASIDEAASTASASLVELRDSAALATEGLAAVSDASEATAAKVDESAAAADAGGAALSGMAAVGKIGAIALAAGVAFATDKVVKMGTSFQAQMELIHTQAQVPQQDLANLGNQVLNLSGYVAQSPQSLAAALYHVESAFQSTGITGAGAMQILKIAAEGATTGGADLVDVTNALDGAIVSGYANVKNYSAAMGELNAIVGSGDMTMEQLAQAFGTGQLAALKSWGLSLTDVGAALATFGDNNIRGARAATMLRMSIQAMAEPIEGGAAELAKLGMTSTELATDMQKGGLMDALDDLHNKLAAAGVSANQYGQIFTEVFGKRAGVGLLVLEDQLARVQSKYNDISNASHNFGADWQATMQTVNYVWHNFLDTIEAVGVKIFDYLLPIVQSIASWLGKNKDVIDGVAGAFAGLILACIGVYIAMNPIILAIAGIIAGTALLGAAIGWIVEHWDSLTKAVQNYIEAHRGLVAVLAIIFAPITAVVGAIIGVIKIIQNWGAVTKAFSKLWSEVWNTIGPDVDNAVTDVENGWEKLNSVLNKAWDALAGGPKQVSIGGSLNETVHELIDKVTTTINKGAKKAGEAFKNTGNEIAQYMQGGMTRAQAIAAAGSDGMAKAYAKGQFRMREDSATGFAGIPNAITSALGKGKEYTATGMGDINDSYTTNLNQTQSIWQTGLSAIESFWSNIWSKISSDLSVSFGAIESIVGSGLSTAWNTISHIVEQIETFWNSHWQEIKEVVGPIMVTIGALIEAGLGLISSIWKPAWSAFSDLVKGTFSTISNTIEMMLDVIIGIISVGLDLITLHWGKAWNDLVTMVTGVLTHLWNILSGAVTTLGKVGGDIGSAVVNGILYLFGGLAKSVGGAIHDAWEAIDSKVTNWADEGTKLGKAIVDAIVKAIKGGAKAVGGAVEGLINDIPGGKTVSHFLGFGAEGGVFNSPVIAGEAGPEAIIPLTKPVRAQQVMKEAGLNGTGGGGGSTIILQYSPNVSISGTTQQQAAQLQAMLAQHDQQILTILRSAAAA